MIAASLSFQQQIQQGISNELPSIKAYDTSINHAPKRKNSLNKNEKLLAIKNALRYFPKKWHKELAAEFYNELESYGRIYMYRFKPDYKMYARPIDEYPSKCKAAAGIMLMIQNNLDPKVAQHPEELITYGGNGAVFQNWAQYLLTMQYLSEMTREQTLHMYSGHPMGLFPSSKSAPRVVITNGMMIPNYSKPDDWEKYNALGVTQYGQMTAGSYMYIGPQGIVHGTTITVMNAFRNILPKNESIKGKIFLTSGLGGMSGAQPKAGNIAGCITVCAEVNIKAAEKRHEQGWVDELHYNIDELIARVKQAQINKEVVSLAYCGNVVEVWEAFDKADIFVHVGSDQTSLHNPWSGGYYPESLSYEEANEMMRNDPELFKSKVQESLKRHAKAVNLHTEKGTYFFDYGNAFLLESSRAGADILAENKEDFKYPSYVQDILGPMCFDYGFGPFRWVCTSGDANDLKKTDHIAAQVIEEIMLVAPEEIQQQLADNLRRDHHDVSGTDSPYRETSNIYDGSRFTADMAIHNVIGDSFRGATWVSIHNGGGVGWGEVINGGFGLLLDGSEDAEKRLTQMLFYDVNNGIARRSWARNDEAMFAIKREMERSTNLKVTLPELVDEEVLKGIE